MPDDLTRTSAGHKLVPVVPAVAVYHSAAQTVGTGVVTTMAFDSERYDTDSPQMHDPANNSVLTCQTAGKYRIWVVLNWSANTTGDRQTRIILNPSGAGQKYLAIVGDKAAGGGLGTAQGTSRTYALAVGDYVGVWVYQDSGVNLTVESSDGFSIEFGMELVTN